jgi:titin
MRQAILDANSSPGPDTIAFNIPGGGVHTIALATFLPEIADSVTIDGYTQPGAQANTLAVGNNAVLLIELDGTSAGEWGAGVMIRDPNASGSVVRGLTINSFEHDGIVVEGTADCKIAGNFIGTDPSGTVAKQNGWRGIWLAVGATNNVIGGSLPTDRNVISGNGISNVTIGDSTTVGNRVIGNYLGPNAAGTAGLSAYSPGVEFNAAGSNVVGGTQPGEGNLISGNGYWGVVLENVSIGTQVMGNLIGTDATGTSALGNSGGGVVISAGPSGPSSGNSVGGLTVGAGNVIAFNNGPGVLVTTSDGEPNTNNAILSNAIFGNTGLGIDLGGEGVTANSPGSPHAGPNHLQSFPVLTGASWDGTRVLATGVLSTAPSTDLRVQFFANTTCDPAGYGQGQTYIGVSTLHSDASGSVAFTSAVPLATLPGSVLTATATTIAGDTSEFSPCRDVVATNPRIRPRRHLPTATHP